MRKKISTLLLSSFLTSQLFFSFVIAESYFDQILAGVVSMNIVRGVVDRLEIFKSNPDFWSFGVNGQQQKEQTEANTISEEENIFLSGEKKYFEEMPDDLSVVEGELVISKEEQKKIEEEKKKVEVKKKQENILGSILQKLGFTGGTQGSLAPISQSTDMTNMQSGGGNLPSSNPFVYSQPQSPANSNPSMSQSGLSPYSGDALQKYLGGQPAVGPTSPQRLGTPYSGPGGSLPGECGIPKGPWAYNIGGNSVSCSAETVVTGFKTQLRGKFGAGYINPLTEKGQSRPGSGAGNCADASTANQYGEGCFASYAGGAGQAYIQEQLLHWQAQGKVKGQKCVPVDIDNCDSIGSANYKNILDQVEIFNNQADVKIKVLTKNPHLGGCNFFSHPAVVGAFIEEISPAEAQKVSQMRNKPEQVLLFARGGTGSNQKLKQIESLKIPNSAYSYDQGGEYQNIVDCTYNP